MDDSLRCCCCCSASSLCADNCGVMLLVQKSSWAPPALEEVEVELERAGTEEEATSACKQRRISSNWCEAEKVSCSVSPVVFVSSVWFRRSAQTARFVLAETWTSQPATDLNATSSMRDL